MLSMWKVQGRIRDYGWLKLLIYCCWCVFESLIYIVLVKKLESLSSMKGGSSSLSHPVNPTLKYV